MDPSSAMAEYSNHPFCSDHSVLGKLYHIFLINEGMIFSQSGAIKCCFISLLFPLIMVTSRFFITFVQYILLDNFLETLTVAD